MIGTPVIDAAQAATWDERARTAAGIPSRVLMESAGRAAATVLARTYAERLNAGVLVVAGHGNNGGDGWVVARALRAAGVHVWAVDEFRERSPDCEANRELALGSGVERIELSQPWPVPGVVVDAVLGTGAAGAPRGGAGELCTRLRAMTVPVVAIDGPSGLDLSTGEANDPVPADLTVTFGGIRRGHLLGRRWCGRLAVVDIGFPAADPEWPVLVDDHWAAGALPPLDPSMHKATRGRVLILGGDGGMAGAVHHAATAAFGVGAGLVKLVAHASTVSALQGSLPDALTVTSALGPGIEPAVDEALSWADAIILGPGIGRGEDRAAFVAAVLAHGDTPAIVDADALHAGEVLFGGPGGRRVLTPHLGEFRTAFPWLAGHVVDDRFDATAQAATRTGGTVLLKGVPTIVAHPEAPVRVVAAGNPGLATGGSGDLLAGFIGSLLARGMEPQPAAALGAFILGRAAEVAARSHTARATRPADVVAALPDVWRSLADPLPPVPPILLQLEPPAVV